MNTMSKSDFVVGELKAENVKVKSSSTFWEDAEYNRYGITPMILLVVVCIGGIAAATATSNLNMYKIFAISLATTLSLTTILAVTPMKTIAAFCSVALLIDLAIIISNL